MAVINPRILPIRVCSILSPMLCARFIVYASLRKGFTAGLGPAVLFENADQFVSKFSSWAVAMLRAPTSSSNWAQTSFITSTQAWR